MPISVTCSECNSTYRVADEAAGKAIKCKKCGARVPVPAAGEEESAKARDGDDEGGGETKPKKKAGSGKLLLIIGGVVVFLGCCCILPGGTGGLGWYLGWFSGGAGDTKGAGKEKAVVGGGGKVMLEKKETLAEKDPPKANGKPAKEYKVKLEQGKNYVIDLKADKKVDFKKLDFNNPPHDPYLRLLDAGGKEVARNDDFEPGVSLDSQIRYTPTQTGEYTIQATVLGLVPPGGMPFSLTVKEQ
jgi:hypothetical protein